MLGRLLKGFKGHDRHLAWNLTDAAPETLRLTSSAFADGAPIPRRYAGLGIGQNISPPLAIEGVSHDTADLLLVMQDPDAPLPYPITHLVARLIPATKHVAEGAFDARQPVAFGKGSFGRIGYAGPRPVPGHGPHRYIFQLFAVSRPLNLNPRSSLGDYLKEIKGAVLARGRLTGTFER